MHARPIVGVIPAAGRATRLAPLPCSKELLPVGVHDEPAALRGRPKVVSHYLLERMRDAGASRVFFVLRSGKFDIADYHGDGSALGLSLAYLVVGEPWGPPFSIAQAAPFVGEATVLMQLGCGLLVGTVAALFPGWRAAQVRIVDGLRSVG